MPLTESEELSERSQNVQMTRMIVEKDMKIPEHLTTSVKEATKETTSDKEIFDHFEEMVVLDQDKLANKIEDNQTLQVNAVATNYQVDITRKKTTEMVKQESFQSEVRSQTATNDKMVDSFAQTMCSGIHCADAQEQRDQLTQGQDIRAAGEPVICVTVSGENVSEAMTLQGPVAVILQKLQTMLSNQNPEDTVVKQLVTESTVDLNTKSPAEDDDNLMSPAEEEEQMDGEKDEEKSDTDEAAQEEHEVLSNAQEVMTTIIENQTDVMTDDVVMELPEDDFTIKDENKKMISCWTGREEYQAFIKYQEYFINSFVRERKGIG